MELGRVSALYGAGARLVGSCAVDVVFGLDDVAALWQEVEEIAGGVVLRCAVVALAPIIAAQLLHRLHAGGTLVGELYEIIVAVGLDGDAHDDFVAYFQR